MDCLKFHECELCERASSCEYDKHIHSSWVRKTRMEMLKKVVVVNGVKGGLGSTSFACALSANIAKRGLRTALIETSFFSVLPDYLGYDSQTGLEIMMDGIIPPISEYGFSYLSPSLFMQKDKRPIFWDAEAVVKFIKKMVVNTNWGDIDCLVLDVSCSQSGLLKEIKTFFGEKIVHAVVLVDFKDAGSAQTVAHIDHVKLIAESVSVLSSPSKDLKPKDKLGSLPFVESLFLAGAKTGDVVGLIMEPYDSVLEEVIKSCL